MLSSMLGQRVEEKALLQKQRNCLRRCTSFMKTEILMWSRTLSPMGQSLTRTLRVASVEQLQGLILFWQRWLNFTRGILEGMQTWGRTLMFSIQVGTENGICAHLSWFADACQLYCVQWSIVGQRARSTMPHRKPKKCSSQWASFILLACQTWNQTHLRTLLWLMLGLKGTYWPVWKFLEFARYNLIWSALAIF